MLVGDFEAGQLAFLGVGDDGLFDVGGDFGAGLAGSARLASLATLAIGSTDGEDEGFTVLEAEFGMETGDAFGAFSIEGFAEGGGFLFGGLHLAHHGREGGVGCGGGDGGGGGSRHVSMYLSFELFVRLNEEEKILCLIKSQASFRIFMQKFSPPLLWRFP